ncbi:MAG TPA: DEAD/DEAH box helicase [Methylomirabilota bacterium]|nr:DEAD/DEAH box helicase [Methylomirabilota bacterium]
MFDLLHPDLLRAVDALGYTVPTPIQKDAIPPAIAGRDVLACAMTGSGKTAAFMLPILQRLLSRPPRHQGTRALVLAPTRELAAQIDEQRVALGRFTRLSGAAVFGGVSMGPQEMALRRGLDVLVATPGRLLDHLQRGTARLGSIETLVLDEADRMLDMGFLPDIRRILRYVPVARQTLLFSATMPPAIVSLARELLCHPVTLDVERPSAPAAGVSHAAYPVASELKLSLLVQLLGQPGVKNALVFTRTKHRANRVADGLGRRGVSADRIHGNRSQAQRTQALAAFKAGRCRVLVATDIAARGIDVTGLSHVVNFDVPPAPEDYIHRVGRTARAEAVGDALTLVSPAEEADLRSIERAVGTRIRRVTLPNFDYTARPAERLEIPLAQRLAAHRGHRRGGPRNGPPHPPASRRAPAEPWRSSVTRTVR